jgi:hypothetical protein
LATIRIRALGGLSLAAGRAEQPRWHRAVASLRLSGRGGQPDGCVVAGFVAEQKRDDDSGAPLRFRPS